MVFRSEDNMHPFVEKIYSVLSDGVSLDENFKCDFTSTLKDRLNVDKRKESQERGLRLSMVGWPCTRKIWYQVNHPELAEPLRPETRLKFLFGDMMEDLVLSLLEAGGCEVTEKQKEVEVAGVKGHIDAIVDGLLVDVKSASTYSMKKFREGVTTFNDPFGYLVQLGCYARALGVNEAAFIAVDKQHGHVVVDYHKFDDDFLKSMNVIVETVKKDVDNKERVPERRYDDEPDGKSGNRKLGLQCSYCSFKQVCWPNLRTFLYSNGPRFMTHVVKEPNVPEVKE